jgi:hypothetical protein
MRDAHVRAPALVGGTQGEASVRARSADVACAAHGLEANGSFGMARSIISP